MVTIKEIWNCEQEYSPGITQTVEAQLLKVGEEYGEVCDALLRHDAVGLRDELADLLNTIFGLSLLVFKDSDELSTGLLNAIHKMAEKYKGD